MFLWFGPLGWNMKTPVVAEAHCDAPCGVCTTLPAPESLQKPFNP